MSDVWLGGSMLMGFYFYHYQNLTLLLLFKFCFNSSLYMWSMRIWCVQLLIKTMSDNAIVISCKPNRMIIPNFPSVNTCDQPTITNGTTSPNTSTIDYQELYNLTCDVGYTASSEELMNCQADGTLDLVHTCDSKYSSFSESFFTETLKLCFHNSHVILWNSC